MADKQAITPFPYRMEKWKRKKLEDLAKKNMRSVQAELDIAVDRHIAESEHPNSKKDENAELRLMNAKIDDLQSKLNEILASIK